MVRHTIKILLPLLSLCAVLRAGLVSYDNSAVRADGAWLALNGVIGADELGAAITFSLPISVQTLDVPVDLAPTLSGGNVGAGLYCLNLHVREIGADWQPGADLWSENFAIQTSASHGPEYWLDAAPAGVLQLQADTPYLLSVGIESIPQGGDVFMKCDSLGSGLSFFRMSSGAWSWVNAATTDPAPLPSFSLTGETDTAIVAPEPPMLVPLVLGLLLIAWRRRRTN